MPPPDQIRERILARFPGAGVTVVANPSPSAQHSLAVDAAQLREIATWLRDDPELRLDYCSNVTGVDWPSAPAAPAPRTAAVPAAAPAATSSPAASPPDEPRRSPAVEGGSPPAASPPSPSPSLLPTPPADGGKLEVVYHLYSMTLKHGPVILRVRTGNRADDVTVPSLTPVWRSCEFQEREVFDLFGVVFEGHPDLRRILMWDAFKDYPMRKDYVEPDDYEWEPTAHGEVSTKAAAHHRAASAETLAASPNLQSGSGQGAGP